MTTGRSVGGRELSYVRCGKGPTLVFLHFFGGSAGSWRGVVDRLQRQHECIAIDLPGFGSSDPLETWSVDAQATAVDDLLQALGVGPCLLLGHSMGAKIAFALALRRPRTVSGLITVAGSPPGPEPGDPAERVKLVVERGDRAAMAALVGKISYRPLDPALQARTVDDHLAVHPDAWSWWLREGVREDLSARISALEAPALLISGAEDPVFAPDVHREVAAGMVRGRHHVMEKVGHLVPLEEPGRLSALISEFVGRTTPVLLEE